MDFTDAITENTLRAIRFERPQYIPVVFWINPACWHHYPPDTLLDLASRHPLLFPDPPSPSALLPWERAGEPYVDSWGCTWETTDDGITGSVVQHPLADWDALERFVPPDPDKANGMGPIDWCAIEEKIVGIRQEGKHPVGGLEHGHTFLRLSYLRGYERLLYDMADGDPSAPAADRDGRGLQPGDRAAIHRSGRRDDALSGGPGDAARPPARTGTFPASTSSPSTSD